ncbi:unnamed protein product, partial [Vitis vinifera]
MLALGMGSYQAALFHLITHAYSKALFKNMVLMGGLTKHVPITKNTFLLGTLSLCGIPPLACFWSKDEILNDSWLYSPIFAIIACLTTGLTAFYMFRIYLLTFEGYFNVHCKNYSGKKVACSIQYLYGVKKVKKQLKKNAVHGPRVQCSCRRNAIHHTQYAVGQMHLEEVSSSIEVPNLISESVQ